MSHNRYLDIFAPVQITYKTGWQSIDFEMSKGKGRLNWHSHNLIHIVRKQLQ